MSGLKYVMVKSLRSYIHVVIQFSVLFYIFLSGPVWINSPLLVVELSGFLIGAWSIVVMRKSYLTIFPEPDKSFQLIKKGPYKIIRHPMYLSLFLVIIPLLIVKPTEIRLLSSILFAINQILKLLYEEKLIRNNIEGYTEYMKKTWRLIPLFF